MSIKTTIFTYRYNASLDLFAHWWLCNVGDNGTIDLAIVIRAHDKWYLTH